MKTYKQILEAINRGIQLALDDFDDEDQVQNNIKSKQVQNRDYTKEYLDWQKLMSKLENKTLSKQDIEELVKLSKLTNLKYTVNLTGALEDIVDYIDSIDHNANLNWIDTSKLRDMSALFVNKYEFNGDISQWDVSKVENMSRMFESSGFNGDISQWDISKVKNMKQMFYDSCFNKDISKWNTSSLNYMNGMFAYSPFKGNISNWNINNVIDYDDHIFDNCPIKDEYKPNLKI